MEFNNGLIISYGKTSARKTVTFPLSFTVATFIPLITRGDTDTGLNEDVMAASRTISSFYTTSEKSYGNVFWAAIGH